MKVNKKALLVDSQTNDINFNMNKIGKIILSILSWGPFVWTILILTAARMYHVNPTTHSIFYPMKKYFLLSAEFYIVYGGFFIWIALTVLLTWKKIITRRQCVINICLTILGLLTAYLSIHYDIFGVRRSYID